MCVVISIGYNNTNDAFDSLRPEELEQNRHVIAAVAASFDGRSSLRTGGILFNLQIWESDILQDALKFQRGEALVDLVFSNF